MCAPARVSLSSGPGQALRPSAPPNTICTRLAGVGGIIIVIVVVIIIIIIIINLRVCRRTRLLECRDNTMYPHIQGV